MNQFESNKKLFDPILNILLVANDARPGALIETYNWDGMSKKEIALVKKMAKENGLMITEDLFPGRFFITKKKIETPESDEEIAELLGFYAIDPLFGDEDEYRISATILEVQTDTSVGSQVYRKKMIDEKDFRRFIARQVEKYDSVMIKLDLPYRFEAKFEDITPKKLLIQNVGDYNFVKDNLHEYGNLMFNCVAMNSMFSQDESLILTHYSTFLYLFNLAMNDFFNNLVETYESHKDSENDFERKIIEEDQSQYETILNNQQLII